MAATNPCPCGYWGDSRCMCTPGEIQRHAERLTRPLLDRILRVARPIAGP
ncbi:MAG: hypothetical protein EHM19_04645 [Candidatus Latescibacterota bacterium]|nr:MAG: hypothetical protein EHM19_04645 [Candidatus Latescibacterota bacterium]